MVEPCSMASQWDNEMSSDTEGVVLRIEKTSIHDGQGLRTVVFLKGCPLSCQWCSTPESQRPVFEKVHIDDRCTGCGTCVDNCPSGALTLIDGRVKTDVLLCSHCFSCVAICPEDAHKGYGKIMTVAQVLEEISKDEIFFFHSGGGVTISGGECLLQPEFVEGVLRECRLRNINTAIETSLFAPWQIVEGLLPFLNTIYVDLKHPDGKMHKKFTGVENGVILNNLRKLDQSELSFGLHLRIPLIPGINDADDTLLQVISIAESLNKLEEVEILPYHRLGMISYDHLGRNYHLKDLATPSKEYIIERFEFVKNQSTVPVKIGGGYG